MRTTLTLDDELVQELKKAALETGKPFKQVVNEALRAGLRELAHSEPRAYRLRPVSLGYPRVDIDLDKALNLADALEDDALGRQLEQHK